MRCIVLYILLFCSNIYSNVIKTNNANQINYRGLRIIGGYDADEIYYPFIVRLDHRMTFADRIKILYFQMCTGSVISPIWTLTAAHCFGLESVKINGNVTRSPIIRYLSPGPTAWGESDIKLVIKHPSFQRKVASKGLSNDIALVQSSLISLNEYALVSAIDHVALLGQEALLTGYGDTNSSHGKIGDATSVGKPLQMLSVIIVKCDKAVTRVTPAACLARNCLDVSGLLCSGDSGGPTLHPSGVIGVNSMGPKLFRKFCSTQVNTPEYDVGLITPISPFTDWISETIRNNTSRFL